MRKRSWTEAQLKLAVKNSTSVRQVLQKLSLREAGGNYTQINHAINDYKIAIKHFTGKGWSKGLTGIGKPFISLDEILVKNNRFQSHKLKKRLFKEGLKKPKCEECGWAKLSVDGRIPIELDHINGDRMDNRIENLRILCPNCHSLKPTHRGLNRKKKLV
jgi:hypothetical protein